MGDLQSSLSGGVQREGCSRDADEGGGAGPVSTGPVVNRRQIGGIRTMTPTPGCFPALHPQHLHQNLPVFPGKSDRFSGAEGPPSIFRP